MHRSLRLLRDRLLLAFLFVLLPMVTPFTFAQQSEADVLVAHAIFAYDDKQYDKALALLDRALTLTPNNTRALYYRGQVYLAQKQPALAARTLEQAVALDPTDIVVQYQLGLAYFLQGQYDKADGLLTDVFVRDPQFQDVAYYVGFLRYRRQDYTGAVQAFDASRSEDQNIRQLAGFYKGLALGLLGLSDRAIVELEEAQRIQPASPLTGPLERLRDTVTASKPRERDQRLRAEIRIGGFYDDNVPVNPNPSTDPVAESLRTRFSRSSGLLIAPRLDYSWYRRGPFEAIATYSFFQTLNFNHNLSEFNFQDHYGGLAGFYRGTLASMPYQIGLQYAFDYLLLDNAAFLARHTPTLSMTLVENAANLSVGILRFQDKDFLRDSSFTVPFPQEDRDARNYLAGVTHVFRFAEDRHLFRIGYQFDRENARGSDFSYSGHRILTGFQYTLDWGQTRLRYDYEVHLRYYSHVNSLFPSTAPNTVRRRDTEHLHYFRIEKPLPYNLTLSAEYQGILNGSNVSIFDYDRNVFSLIVTWVY